MQCIAQRIGSIHHPGRWTNQICEQVTHRSRDSLCKHWEETPSHCIWLWEVPYILVWKDICCWDWSQPLEMISMKNLTAALVRLQRMLIWLQQYDMVIMYRPGKEMLLANALTFLPSRTDTEIKLDLRVNAISKSDFTTSCLIKIAAEKQRDSILFTVHRWTLNSWPQKCTNIPRITRNYWNFRDELSIDDDLLMKEKELSFWHHAETPSWKISIKAMKASTKRCPWLGHVCIDK